MLRCDAINDLLRHGIGLLVALDAGRTPVETVSSFEKRARAAVPTVWVALFDNEVAALGHAQYELGEQSTLAGMLDGLAAVDHALRGLDPVEHVPGPCRAWLPPSASWVYGP